MSLLPSSSISRQKYDVFLSFRGEDTRKKFTDNLYAALERKGIVPFKDDLQLEAGEEIAPELSKAIQESWCSLIVFSETYAFSSWCLNELVQIVEQRNKTGHKIFPIFYHVDPSDLRKQTGRVDEAFSKHEQTYKESKDKIKRWRTALTKVANIKGFCSSNRSESEFIEDIVTKILAKLYSVVPNELIGIDSNSKVEHLKNMASEAVEALLLNKRNSNTEPVTYQSLSELEIGKPPGEIRVRVARTWYNVNYKSNNVLSFNFLVIDEKGDALQATVIKSPAGPFESQIKEGNLYIISGFRVTKQKSSYNAISAPCSLTITSTTKVVQTEIPTDSIPKHHFQFIEFENLSPRCKKNDVLTDVIGCIISISKANKVYVGTNPNEVQKRNLQLQNIRGETIDVTLWNDFALSVDEELVGLQTNPILILAAVIVTEYNRKTSIATCSVSKLYLDLDIPIVAEMKARFQDQVEPVQLLEVHQRPQLLQVDKENLDRVTVQQLLEIDHKKAPNTNYTCIAQIKHIDCAQGWYYLACKICHKSLVQIGETFWCLEKNHGERTPFLCYKLVMTVEDETNSATFIAFADVAEKLTAVSITRLALIGQDDKNVLPEAIGRKLINQKVLFGVNIITKSLETGDLVFSVNLCCNLDEARIPTNVPSIASSSQIETTSKSDGKQLNKVEQQPTSPTQKHISQDFFLEESPVKKLKF
ncbi:hypothetical protein CRYUN_Cryun38cG0018900 [Craigia yunnanensis]